MDHKRIGRPREVDEGKRTSMFISVDDLEVLNEIGRGNRSKGLRMLIEKYREAAARVQEKNAA